MFPIGEYTKPETREMARAFGLPTAEKKDSQGICFIGEIDVKAFLQKHIPVSRGLVRTATGRAVGEHDGLSFYTMGQRAGLGSSGGGIPYYVAGKDFAANALVVAEGPYDEKLFTQEVAARDIHWISGRAPRTPLRCEARIRYRQPLQACTVRTVGNDRADRNDRIMRGASLERFERVQRSTGLNIIFDEPQRAATPGQSVVFYSGEEMLGGGWIV